TPAAVQRAPTSPPFDEADILSDASSLPDTSAVDWPETNPEAVESFAEPGRGEIPAQPESYPTRGAETYRSGIPAQTEPTLATQRPLSVGLPSAWLRLAEAQSVGPNSGRVASAFPAHQPIPARVVARSTAAPSVVRQRLASPTSM